MASRTLEVVFVGDASNLQGAFRKVGDDAEALEKRTGGLKGALGGLTTVAGGLLAARGVTELGGFLKSAAEGAAEDAAATSRLEQALHNAGGAFDENLGKVNARILAGQKLAFSDDDVRDSFQQLLAATGDTDEALRRQALAMDFARGAHIPLEQASKLLGKVTDENVEVFKRLGITIGEGATEAEAFGVIQEKFGGQAQVFASSTAGQFEQTKIRMSELKEQIGTQLLPVMTTIGTVLVNDVIPKMEQFAAWWATSVQPKIEAFVAWVKPKLAEFSAEVQVQFAKFQTYYESDIKPALDNITTAIVAVVTAFKEHWGQIEPFVRPIFIAIETAMEVLKNAIKLALDVIQGDWEGAWNDIKALVGAILDGMLGLVGAFKDQLIAIFVGIRDAILDIDWLGAGTAIMQAFIDGFQALASTVVGVVTALFNDVKNVASSVISFFYDVGVNIVAGIKNGIASRWDAFIGWVWDQINKLPKVVRDFFGIHSPSQVFHEIGVELMRGLESGIDERSPEVLAKLETLTIAMRNETAKARDAAAALAGVSTYLGGGSWGTMPAGTDTTSSAPVGYYNPSTDLTWTGSGWIQGSWWRPGDPDAKSVMAAAAIRANTAPQTINLVVDGAVLASVVANEQGRSYG